MAASRATIDQLIEQAHELHRRERAITLDSVLLVGRLERSHAAEMLCISMYTLAKQVGLSPSAYGKRAQAARVIHHYPQAAAMIANGETEVSHLAVVARKISPANAEILLSGIKHKSRREVEQLLSVVTVDGRVLERESEVEIRVTLTKSQLALLDRAREVLSHGGKVPSTAEVLLKSVEDLLYRRDPLVKAARQAKAGKVATATTSAAGKGAAAGTADSHAPGHENGAESQAKRTHVPARVHHAAVLRDQCQCTETLGDGSRCPERHNLELDHIVPVCRGGGHTLDNVAFRCRRHNQSRARHEIGEKYLVTWAESRERAAGSFPMRDRTAEVSPRP